MDDVKDRANGANGEGASADAEALKKIAALRSQVRESFGQVVMAMMALPRYRHQSIADLQHLVIDPLIRDQVKSGTWPLRLKAGDWASGDINWLLDVIAPDARIATSVLGNFRQVVKDGELRLHPIVGRIVDEDVLDKMGAQAPQSPDAGGAA